MSASSLFSRLPACGENTSGKPSRACFFHCAICVGWTPYSAAISLAVFCPLIASKATLVFRSALYRFRCTDIVFLLLAGFSIQLFYLIDLSSFLVPLYRRCTSSINMRGARRFLSSWLSHASQLNQPTRYSPCWQWLSRR